MAALTQKNMLSTTAEVPQKSNIPSYTQRRQLDIISSKPARSQVRTWEQAYQRWLCIISVDDVLQDCTSSVCFHRCRGSGPLRAVPSEFERPACLQHGRFS